jgi:hypothetical protein
LGEQAIDDLERLSAAMCACSTSECGDGIMAEMESLSSKYSALRPDNLSQDQQAKLMEHAMKLGECQEKVASLAPSTPKGKTAEARQFIKKMYDGARAYYMDRNGVRGMANPPPPQFPEPKGASTTGPVPPLGTCCSDGGRCQPRISYWNEDVWIALQYSVDDPHYYSYEYKVDNKAKNPNFTVTAYGDLDCDGVYSTFSMYGEVNSIYSDGPAGTAAIYREKELE